MNKRSYFRDIADAYSLPFRKQGLKAFLFSLLLTVIPVTAFIGEGAAYSAAAGRKEGFGGWTKLGLKLIAIQLIYAAPAIAVYGLYTILATYLFLGHAIQLILLFFLILFATRALVLIPVASCAAALGAPLRIAVNGKEMNSIISGSMGRYILTGIMCALMLFVFDLPMVEVWQLAVQYVLASVFVVLYRFFKAGLFMGVVRNSLGIAPPPENHKVKGTGMAKAVTAAVICIALIGNSSLSVFAAGLNNKDSFIRYRPDDDEPQPTLPLESTEYDVYTEENIPNYYRAPERDLGLPSAGTVYDVAGDICNVIPGVSNVKNGLQAAGYYILGALSSNEEQREYCYVNAGYKAAAIVSGCATSWGGKALQIYDKTMSWLGFSDDLLSNKSDEYFGPATLFTGARKLVNGTLEKTGDAFNTVDVALGDFIDFTYETTCETVRKTAEGLDQTYGISEGMEWWLTEPQPLPGQINLFIDNPYSPLNVTLTKYGYTTSNAGGSLDVSVLDLKDINGDPLYDYDPGAFRDDRNDGNGKPAHSNLPALDGSYSGQQETPSLPSVDGLTYDIIPNKVYIDIYDDNTASFSTVVETTFDYDFMGYASESGDAVATVKYDDIELIPLSGVESDGYIPMFRGEFTVRATSYMDVTISGIAYGGESYDMTTEQEADYTVTFILGYHDGEPMIWDGKITSVPVGETEGDVQMIEAAISFTCY